MGAISFAIIGSGIRGSPHRGICCSKVAEQRSRGRKEGRASEQKPRRKISELERVLGRISARVRP